MRPIKSMNVASLVCVIYVTSVSLTYETNACLLQCVQEVLKCQQNENGGFFSQIECCDKYTLCYFLCQPEATTAPLCHNNVKRGSWNKRQVLRQSWPHRGQLRDTSRESWPHRGQLRDASRDDDLNEDNQFFL